MCEYGSESAYIGAVSNNPFGWKDLPGDKNTANMLVFFCLARLFSLV